MKFKPNYQKAIISSISKYEQKEGSFAALEFSYRNSYQGNTYVCLSVFLNQIFTYIIDVLVYEKGERDYLQKCPLESDEHVFLLYIENKDRKRNFSIGSNLVCNYLLKNQNLYKEVNESGINDNANEAKHHSNFKEFRGDLKTAIDVYHKLLKTIDEYFGFTFFLDNFSLTSSNSEESNWLEDFNRALREEKIKEDTEIRISYAFGFKIGVDGQYLLVYNTSGMNVYQIPARTYPINDEELNYLKETYHVREDTKLTTKIKKDDYRLHVPAKYLIEFYERFKSQFLNNYDLWANGFKKNLVFDNKILSKRNNRIVNLKSIKRDIRFQYSQYFNTYEMVLLDIVEYITNDKIKKELRKLIKHQKKYRFEFATEEEIKSDGVCVEKKKMTSDIATHTKKMF